MCANANRHGNEIEHNAQYQARKGADKGDQSLRTWRVGFATEARYSAEQPQGDPLDFDASSHRNDGMRELVSQQGGQEHEGRHHAGSPVSAGSLARHGRRKNARRETPRDQGGHDQEAPVEPNVYAEDAAEADVLVHVASQDEPRPGWVHLSLDWIGCPVI